MAIKIKGFDQITAWIGGLALSGMLFTGLWYMGKWIASYKLEADEARVAATERDLKIMADEINEEKSRKFSSRASGDASTSTAAPNDQGIDNSNKKPPFERWGYSSNLAPWYWPTLNTKWAGCGSKTGQSPIDITGARLDEKLKSLKFYYAHGVTHFTLIHDTVEGSVDHGSYMEWEGERFDLRRMMFRTPSEHRVNSLPYEMEIQLEHVALTGKTLFLSLLVTPGKSSEFINYITADLPRMEGEIKDIERVNWGDLLPAKPTYWTYTGSTTTPPCTSDTKWIILTEPITTTKKIIDKFVLLQKSNVRPVYPLGKRVIGRSNR